MVAEPTTELERNIPGRVFWLFVSGFNLVSLAIIGV
jgi:hypothetical protein